MYIKEVRNTRHPDVKSEPPEATVIRIETITCEPKREELDEATLVDCAMDKPVNELIENGCDLEYDEDEPPASTESTESMDEISSQMPYEHDYPKNDESSMEGMIDEQEIVEEEIIQAYESSPQEMEDVGYNEDVTEENNQFEEEEDTREYYQVIYFQLLFRRNFNMKII